MSDGNRNGAWIPVSDLLPEVPSFVIAFDGEDVRTATFVRRGFVTTFGGAPVAATHWMPFPQPPK